MGKTRSKKPQYAEKREKRVRKKLDSLQYLKGPKSQGWVIDEADDVLGKDFEKFNRKNRK
jgi:hypothetical protein